MSTGPRAIHSICDLLAKCRYSSLQTTGDPGAGLFRSLSQASQYATLLPAVYSSFSSNTEHLLQVGNSHLKHLYLVFMKREQHISITLCDVSNDFRHSLPAFSSPEAALRLVTTKKRREIKIIAHLDRMYVCIVPLRIFFS